MGYVHSYQDYEGALAVPELRVISMPATILPISAEPVILARVTVSESPIIEEIPMDMEGLAALIQALEKRLEDRFQGMDQRFQQIDTRFQQLDARFQKAGERMEKIEDHIETISDRSLHLQWMVGVAIILALIALGKQFWPLIDAVVPK